MKVDNVLSCTGGNHLELAQKPLMREGQMTCMAHMPWAN